MHLCSCVFVCAVGVVRGTTDVSTGVHLCVEYNMCTMMRVCVCVSAFPFWVFVSVCITAYVQPTSIGVVCRRVLYVCLNVCFVLVLSQTIIISCLASNNHNQHLHYKPVYSRFSIAITSTVILPSAATLSIDASTYQSTLTTNTIHLHTVTTTTTTFNVAPSSTTIPTTAIITIHFLKIFMTIAKHYHL